MAFRKKKAEDLQSYVALMIANQNHLQAFINSMMPGSLDAKDVLQNTNAVLWQKREKFEPGTNFKAWAFRIARYQIRHQIARDRRDGRLVFSDKLINAIAESTPTESRGDGMLEALEGCVSKLTDEQREIIDERYMRGHSLVQLAERSGRSSGSLRVALHRIREMLKSCVERSLAEEAP